MFGRVADAWRDAARSCQHNAEQDQNSCDCGAGADRRGVICDVAKPARPVLQETTSRACCHTACCCDCGLFGAMAASHAAVGRAIRSWPHGTVLTDALVRSDALSPDIGEGRRRRSIALPTMPTCPSAIAPTTMATGRARKHVSALVPRDDGFCIRGPPGCTLTGWGFGLGFSSA